MVLIALGVLVVAALGAAGLARQTQADSAIKDMKQQAPSITSDLQALGRLGELRRAANRTASGQATARVCRLLDRLLGAAGGSIVAVDDTGTIGAGLGQLCPSASDVLHLPHGLAASDLDTARLLDQRDSSGTSGQLAFLATPIQQQSARTLVLVLTQHVETRPLGRAGPYLFGTGALALIAATVVSAILARRITRPVAAMQSTAGRIAAGDLSARVSPVPTPDDELASLARSINTMADELETARGHERSFLLSISHDLRTPLTSIKGYAEGMADGVIASPDDRARAAGVIATEARRLERLVADLLDLARLDTHEFSLTPQPVDARRVVGATVQGFAPAARDWGITLSLTPGEPVPAQVDPERLGQIVANLVENALKYATSSVTVAVGASNGSFEVRV